MKYYPYCLQCCSHMHYSFTLWVTCINTLIWQVKAESTWTKHARQDQTQFIVWYCEQGHSRYFSLEILHMQNSACTWGAPGVRASWLQFKTKSDFRKICIRHVCKSSKGAISTEICNAKTTWGLRKIFQVQAMLVHGGRHFIVKIILRIQRKIFTFTPLQRV